MTTNLHSIKDLMLTPSEIAAIRYFRWNKIAYGYSNVTFQIRPTRHNGRIVCMTPYRVRISPFQVERDAILLEQRVQAGTEIPEFDREWVTNA